MIVPDDRKHSSILDVPPPYVEIPHEPLHSPSWSTTRISIHPRPTDIRSSNYVKIKRRNMGVRGTYVIDAGLRVPDDILSSSTSLGNEGKGRGGTDGSGKEVGDTTRKNLHLESVNASVSADVWLVDDGESRGVRDPTMEGKRAELEFKAHNGCVNVKLDSTTERPFSLVATSHNSCVSVAIPSDFVGPVTMTAVNWCVSLQGSMKTRLVTFSEEKGTRRCFVGDYRKVGYNGRKGWTGSTIDISSQNCGITLSFVDEQTSFPGFWRKLFGS